MANLLLTELCNRSCPYCFAKDYMETADNAYLAFGDLIYVADLLEQTGEKHLSLLGGEPTLHPEFSTIIKYLYSRGFRVNVFTNGNIPKSRLEHLKDFFSLLDRAHLTFVCNVNHPDICTENELGKTKEFFSAFHAQTKLSLNIYEYDFDWGYALDYIRDYDLLRDIRVGIAHPIPNQSNRIVKKENMPAMARTIMKYVDLCAREHITLGFDCGMPLCLFSDEDLGRVFKNCSSKLRFSCGPAIDIGPDMNVWTCFPLSGLHKKSIYDFNSMREIGDYFNALHKKIREQTKGIFDECSTCPHIESGICDGGCLGHIISEFDADTMNAFRETYP